MSISVYEEEFQVEKIIAKRDYPFKAYLIKWENYDIRDSTWEPIEHLENAVELVDEFEKKLAVKNYEKFYLRECIIERSEKLQEFVDSEDIISFYLGRKRKKSEINKEEKEKKKHACNYNIEKNDNIKNSKKYKKIIYEFPIDEEISEIKSVKMINEKIHFLIEFKIKNDGIKNDDVIIPSSKLAEYDPIIIIEFYERKIKFV
jgi:hypothetical protein